MRGIKRIDVFRQSPITRDDFGVREFDFLSSLGWDGVDAHAKESIVHPFEQSGILESSDDV